MGRVGATRPAAACIVLILSPALISLHCATAQSAGAAGSSDSFVVPITDAVDTVYKGVVSAAASTTSLFGSVASQSELVLYPASDANGALPPSFPFMEAISKPAGSALYISDVIAANRWLCTQMGGEQLEDMRCSKEGAFQFMSVSELDSVRTHSDAMKSVFRSPRSRSIQGPRGTVQLVSGGLQSWGEWGEAWNRDAAATAAYLRVFLPRPRSLVQVDFMKGSEPLQFACDQCFTHEAGLGGSPVLQRQIMDFWHSDCTSYRCLKAHVIIVDDDDATSDEALLRVLATPLWDQPPSQVKEALRKLCGTPQSSSPYSSGSQGGSKRGSKSSSWSIFGSSSTSAVTQVNGGEGDGGQGVPGGGGVSYKKAGCDVMRERFNDEARARWVPSKRRQFLESEQKVVDFLNGPFYQSMMKGKDTEDVLLRAYRRRLGMEQEPPKDELMDEPRDHVDILLDAVLQAAADDRKQMAYYASIATIFTYAVDKFLWPGLYVGEKFVLTMSLALTAPLIAISAVLGCIVCVNGHIPRLPFIGRKRGTPTPPKEKGTPSKASSSSSSGGAEKSAADDAESENSRLLLRQRLMTLTVKDMREFAARRRILLSPSKRKAEEDAFIRRLPKAALADMLIREASKELREDMFDESSEDEDGGGVGKGGGERVVGGKSKGRGGREGGGGRKKSRIPDSDEDDEDEGVVVTIRTKDKKLQVKGPVQRNEPLSGLLRHFEESVGGGSAYKFYDGEKNEIKDWTTPNDLNMNSDAEMIQAVPVASSKPTSRKSRSADADAASSAAASKRKRSKSPAPVRKSLSKRAAAAAAAAMRDDSDDDEDEDDDEMEEDEELTISIPKTTLSKRATTNRAKTPTKKTPSKSPAPSARRKSPAPAKSPAASARKKSPAPSKDLPASPPPGKRSRRATRASL